MSSYSMLKEGKDSTKKRQQGQDKTKLYSDSEEEVENKFDKKGLSHLAILPVRMFLAQLASWSLGSTPKFTNTTNRKV